MKKNQQGFTLIELMIVIAIIAILMAYAIPAYRDYTVRAKAGEGIALAAGAKQSVSEYYINTGGWPSNNVNAGLSAAANIKGANVQSVEVKNGVVEVKFANDPTLNNKTISLSPTSSSTAGSVEWKCKKGTGLDNKYLPVDCRN